jgi:sulfur-carrier protein
VASAIVRVTGDQSKIQVTVRYFAAARAATGADSEAVTLSPGCTVAELVVGLAERGETLAKVLARCSYLCDGIAVRDDTKTLHSGNTIDVLPPFAGG